MARFQGADAIVVETLGDVDVTFPDVGLTKRGAASDSFAASALLDGVSRGATVARIDLAPSRGAIPRASRAAGGARPVTINVPVGDDQNAAMLVESEGVLRWRMPEDDAARAAAPARRGPSGGRVLRFRVGETAAPAAPTRRGGFAELAGDTLFDQARVYVLKWAARKAVASLREFLESGLLEGVVDLAGQPSDWKPSGASLTPEWPAQGGARLLLMIHGTFSSTMGSFAALGATDVGTAFLKGAQQRYHAIVGYDHSTLTDDPTQNAEKIASALGDLDPPEGASIDIVAYSRGGLVARVLAEELLARRAPGLVVNRVVFVGCTNGGTELANPENWRSLIDLTTNLAAMAGKALGFVGHPLAGKILSESVKTLGGLVQAFVDSGVDPDTVAGIAAMRPQSELIKQLDGAAETPALSLPSYFVVGSHFQPTFFGREGAPARGISAQLALALANFASTGVMKEANDLVVDNPAMRNFGSRAGRLKSTELWSDNVVVYHLNYFQQREVVEALGAFLLSDPPAPAPTVDKSLPILAAEETVAAALARRAEIEAAPAVILARGALSYVRSSGAFLEAIKAATPTLSLVEALDLHESDAAPSGDVVPEIVGAGGFVLSANGTPVGAVLPLGSAPPKSVGPPSPSPLNQKRGVAVPDTEFVAGVVAPAFAVAEPKAVECHFMAEMAPTAPVGLETPVSVTLSRVALAAQEGQLAALADALVRADARLTIEVTPAANCEVASVARIEVDPPSPDRTDTYDFKIRGLAAGPGEVWIDVRDGIRRLARLVLQPTFVATQKLSASASSEPEKPIVTLRIYEIPVGQDFVLSFELESQDLGFLLQRSTSAFGMSRAEYVDSMVYKKLEQANIASTWDVKKLDLVLTAALKPLYEALVPPEIRAKLWEHRNDIGCIQVISSEPFIPWELMKLIEPGKLPALDAPYLAELGLLRWIANAGLAPATLYLRDCASRYVIPDYLDPRLKLDGLAKERNMLTRDLAATPAPVDSVGLAYFLREGEFDLLHFACHGDASNGGVYDASLELQDRPISQSESTMRDPFGVTEVEAYADFRRRAPRRPLVFINACRTGQSGKALVGTGGMAQAFVKSGAGAVVAAAWSITDQPACTFAESFYLALLNGSSLEKAVRLARSAARKAGDPTWLAYTVYGHPYARLTRD